MRLEDHIRTIHDFPKPGIIFRDVTTLFEAAEAFAFAVDSLAERFENREFEQIVGLEARGFVLGAALAQKLGMGLTLVRKAGKLPHETLRESYALEYGTAEFEIHTDALALGKKVLLIDDLIATGGTAEAGIRLLERLGADIIGCGAVIELSTLGGRQRLEALGIPVESLLAFD